MGLVVVWRWRSGGLLRTRLPEGSSCRRAFGEWFVVDRRGGYGDYSDWGWVGCKGKDEGFHFLCD